MLAAMMPSPIPKILGTLALGATPAAAQDPGPNVVVLLTDDQGWADVGYNNPAVHTPHLDALARESAVFTSHYAMPQCTPTRVALMTGRYPSRFGGAALQASNAPAFPLGTPTLASLLQERGYDTFLCGKWHLGSTPDHGPLRFGFDESYGSLAGAVGMYDHRYRRGEFYETWVRDDRPVEGWDNGVHATDLLTREAVGFIERDRRGPFFLYLAFHAVHTPLDERGTFVDQPTALDPEDPTRWRNEDEIPWFHDPEGRIQGEPDPERRLLLAALHHLDHAVGQVVAALERAGVREDTLILFSSDNGPQVNWGGNAYPDDLKLTDFNQPSPWRGRKVDVWEGGIRVPGFAYWPGRIAPRSIETPVHVVDWLPTVAAVVDGAEPSPDWDGVDLGPLLFEDTPLAERDLYWTWSRSTDRWALRRGPWKVVHYGKQAPRTPEDWQLFHLGRDPGEQRDVAADHPEVVAELHRRFVSQRERDATDPPRTD